MNFFIFPHRHLVCSLIWFLFAFLTFGSSFAIPANSPFGQKEASQIRKKTTKGNKSHGKFNAQEKARAESNQLQQVLSLSQDQASKVFNVTVEKERELHYLKHVRHLHKAERTAKHDSIISKYEVKLQTILTEEQFASYKSK